MSARVLAESALRVSDCVTELLRKQPFFGSLVLRLPLRPDFSRETLATDGHEIRYSPRWVSPLVLPQYPRRSRLLNRRGGSDEPRSPVTISRTLMQQAWPSRPPGAALGLTPHAARCGARLWRVWRALPGTCAAIGRRLVVGPSGCSALHAVPHDPAHPGPRLSLIAICMTIARYTPAPRSMYAVRPRHPSTSPPILGHNSPP